MRVFYRNKNVFEGRAGALRQPLWRAGTRPSRTPADSVAPGSHPSASWHRPVTSWGLTDSLRWWQKRGSRRGATRNQRSCVCARNEQKLAQGTSPGLRRRRGQGQGLSKSKESKAKVVRQDRACWEDTDPSRSSDRGLGSSAVWVVTWPGVRPWEWVAEVSW